MLVLGIRMNPRYPARNHVNRSELKSWDEMTIEEGMIMVDCATNGMPRIGNRHSNIRSSSSFDFGKAAAGIHIQAWPLHLTFFHVLQLWGHGIFFFLCGHVVTVCQGMVLELGLGLASPHISGCGTHKIINILLSPCYASFVLLTHLILYKLMPLGGYRVTIYK